MARLTKRYIDSLPVPDSEKFIFDELLPGFGLRLYPTGRKTFLVQYRSGGRTRRVSLGRFGTVTPDEARSRARELLGTVAAGSNPSEDRRRERLAPTVASLCERFLDEHAQQHCKQFTIREYRRLIEKHIKPTIGAFRLSDVARADVSELHHRMRATPYQANQALSVMSKMFNLSEIWGLRPDGSNPCRHVKKYRVHQRERFLSPEELKTLGKVLSDCEADGRETKPVVAAFRLLILTGCRLSEIRTLKWEFLKPGYLVLPDSKTGPRRIPRTPEIDAVISGIPEIPNNPYIITGLNDGQPINDLQKPWRRIRELSGLEDVRIHDLRHTYASNAVMGGMDILMVSKLLGHTQIQTTMRYAHLADDPVKAAAAKIASSLGHAMTAETTDDDPTPTATEETEGSNVVQFPMRTGT